MASFVLFDDFGYELGRGTHQLHAHTFKAVLVAAANAPAQASNAVLADITQISNGNGYTTGGATITMAWAETSGGSGVWRFGNSSSDCTWTASGGSIGPFRYVVIYNDTPTSPADPLVGYLDYGSDVTVTTGNTFTVDAGTNGFFEFTIP